MRDIIMNSAKAIQIEYFWFFREILWVIDNSLNIIAKDNELWLCQDDENDIYTIYSFLHQTEVPALV